MPGPTRNVGAKVVLDGEKEYKQALQELNTGNRTLASEMKKLQAEFKGIALKCGTEFGCVVIHELQSLAIDHDGHLCIALT